ncbi:MAG: hypothetical protein WA672_00610, partial [Candidatus Angelobacter sp.]
CVDEGELEDLFDQTKEDNLRVAPAFRFHEAQRARARLLFEYLRRMGFNSMALLVWAYAEQKRVQSPGMPRNEELAQNIREIIDLGTEVRFYFILALSKLSVQLLLDELRVVRIRNLPRLRHAAGIDGLESYRRLAQTAVALSAAQRRNAGPRLAILLCGSHIDT